MTIVPDTTTPPCATSPEVFDDEYLHSPPTQNELSANEWSRLIARRAAAHRRCAGCPLMVDCLYRAVVEVDVSGFVACTTEADRQVMRERLGVKLQPSATTPYGAPRVGGGPVSHETVMAMRHAHPKDTCYQLAERLGCSTSTVKRHLRRERELVRIGADAVHGARPDLPSVDAVLDCFDELETSHSA